MRNNKRRLQLQCTFSSRKVRQDFRYFHVHLNSISLNIHTNISSLFHHHLIRLFQTLTDVTLKVKDDEFKTHKVVLAAASPVFEAMFKEGTKEHEDNYVNIEDIECDIFKVFLRFIYSG